MYINQQAISGTAKYLKRESSEDYEYEYPTIRGVPVDIPYQGVLEESLMSSSRFYGPSFIPEEVLVSYKAMQKLFTEEGFPDSWVQFLEEAWVLRIARACEGPVDIIRSAFFTIALNQKRAEYLGVEQFQLIEGGDLDLRDIELVTNRINLLLGDPRLREQMLTIAANLIPQQSPRLINREPVIELIDKLGLSKGVFLDLGCGVGAGTEDWAKKVNMTVIGLDRQKFDPWYDRWFNKSLGANFIVADFAQGIPFPEGSVAIAVLEYVTHHITTIGIEQALKEILSVKDPKI